MSDTYRTSEFLADFSAAICNTDGLIALEKTGEFYRKSIMQHGVRPICAEIYAIRRRELSAQAAEGGAA